MAIFITITRSEMLSFSKASIGIGADIFLDEPFLIQLIKHQAEAVEWIDSDIQLISHGLTFVGSSKSRKFPAQKVLLVALDSFNKQNCEEYVINPKTLAQEHISWVLSIPDLTNEQTVFCMEYVINRESTKKLT
jgi:hypothetical protein